MIGLSVKDELAIGDTPQARRRRRLNALEAVAGLWANRADIPNDALEFQREMRAEWH